MKIEFQAYDRRYDQSVKLEDITGVTYEDGNIVAIQVEEEWWLVEDKIDLFVVIDGTAHPVTNQKKGEV